MKKDKVVIYTDGAARGNPGRAGWGTILIFGKEIVEIGGSAKHATNNQMELTAPIEALRYVQKNKIDMPMEVFSDSKYVILGITEWIFNWQKNNWRNAAKKPVLNKELWEELYKLSKQFKIKWTYVEGHADNKYNNRADEIATNFADDNIIELKNKK
jgi:ribonuclease HI